MTPGSSDLQAMMPVYPLHHSWEEFLPGRVFRSLGKVEEGSIPDEMSLIIPIQILHDLPSSNRTTPLRSNLALPYGPEQD